MKRNFISTCLFGLIINNYSISYAASSILVDKQTSPSEKAQIELTLGAVFLQPSGTNLDYAVLGYPLPVNSPHWDVETIKPSYTPGFFLAAHYLFPNTEHDLRLNWTHVNTHNSNSVQAGPSEFAVPLFQAGPSAGQSMNNASQQAHATAKFNYDIINLDAGWNADYRRDTQLRFYAGLSGGRLKESLSATYQDNAATYMINSTNQSTFSGIGPLFGLSGLYKLPYRFGITGGLSASALIGSLKAVTDYTSSSPQLAASGVSKNQQSITPKTTSQVVPGLDGKLGLNYRQVFGKGSVFMIEVGYEYATYFNAVVAYNPNTVFGEINLGTIALSSLGKSVSNFSVDGPFVNLSVTL